MRSRVALNFLLPPFPKGPDYKCAPSCLLSGAATGTQDFITLGKLSANWDSSPAPNQSSSELLLSQRDMLYFRSQKLSAVLFSSCLFFSFLIFCWVLVTKEYWTKANWINRILNFNRAVGMDQTWAGQAFWLVPEGRHKGTEEVNELWFSWPSLDIRIPFLYIHVSPLILWKWKLTSTLIFYQRNGLI